MSGGDAGKCAAAAVVRRRGARWLIVVADVTEKVFAGDEIDERVGYGLFIFVENFSGNRPFNDDPEIDIVEIAAGDSDALAGFGAESHGVTGVDLIRSRRHVAQAPRRREG